jgi:hypothetical protein
VLPLAQKLNVLPVYDSLFLSLAPRIPASPSLISKACQRVNIKQNLVDGEIRYSILFPYRLETD